jgi:kinesin family protein 5
MRPSASRTDGRRDLDSEESKGGDKGNIRVVCRFRPLNEKEIKMGSAMCIAFDPDDKTVIMNAAQESLGPMRFTFDHVFPPNTAQVSVYEKAAMPIVDSVLEGFNGTVFAYGQTSSGKTHTMTGPSIDDEEFKGIIPRMVRTVFNTIAGSPDHLEFTVKVSYAEIYMEKIRDLLNPEKSNLKIHEDKNRGVYIADLTEEYVSEELEVYQLMKLGGANREVGSTNMNEGSSRSHSLFSLTVTQNNTVDYSARTGKLYLVDLAGSEKILKTGAEGKRLEEAKGINKSLTMLGLVIYSLTDGKSTHVPYRDSKLTRVLQDSLGGNAKTSLIITCSPHPFNEAETLSTLRFGIRAKSIKNKPKVNRELTVAELKLMLARAENEIQNRDRRIAALELAVTGLGGALPSDSELLGAEERKEEVKGAEYDEVLGQLEEERQKLAEELTKNSHMRRELGSQSTKNLNLSKENDSLISKLATQTIRLSSMDDRLQDQEEQLVRLNALKDSLQGELTSMSQRKAQLEDKVQAAEEEIERLKQDHHSIGTRQSISSKLMTEKDELEMQIAVLKAEAEEKDAILGRLAADNENQSVQKLYDRTNDLIRLEEQLTIEREASSALTKEISSLRAQLHEAVQSAVPDLELIKQHLVEETEKRLGERWGEEKATMLKDLLSRGDKVNRLEVELEETREQMRSMEENMDEGERALKKKVNSLERNLEQLTLMYHQLVSQKSMLKVDNQVYEKKLHRKTERCEELTKQLGSASEQLSGYKHRCEMLANELAEVRSTGRDSAMMRSHASVSGHHKIRKKIKGGNKVILSTVPGQRNSASIGIMSAFSLPSSSMEEEPSQDSQ